MMCASSSVAITYVMICMNSLRSLPGAFAVKPHTRGGTNAPCTRGRRPPARPPAQSLLVLSAELVRQFPQLFAEVVVSVARKTDAALWPPLFDAVGSPSSLLEGLLDAGELPSAACFLLVIDRRASERVWVCLCLCLWVGWGGVGWGGAPRGAGEEGREGGRSGIGTDRVLLVAPPWQVW